MGKIKIAKYSEQREKMAKVGGPIIDVFLHDKSPAERKRILERIVARCQGLKKPIHSKKYLGKHTIADYDDNTGITRVLDNSPYPVYSHELMHALGRNLRNDKVLANAVESYMKAFSRKIPESRFKKLKTSLREGYKLLYSNETPDEYSGLDREGNCLGLLAACIEREINITGSGLFFLSDLNEGKTILEARRASRYHEMRQFLDNYGYFWNKVLRGAA